MEFEISKAFAKFLIELYFFITPKIEQSGGFSGELIL